MTQLTPKQVQKIMYVLTLRAYNSEKETITQYPIQDDDSTINKQLKHRNKILQYLVSENILEKAANSFFFTRDFIQHIEILKKTIQKDKLFENKTEKGVSKKPINFPQNINKEFNEIIFSYFGCFEFVNSQYYLITTFKHTKSFLAFYHLLDTDVSQKLCLGYLENLEIIKQDEREEIKFEEILGGYSIRYFEKKIPNFLELLINDFEVRGFTFVEENMIFKKNHLFDDDQAEIERLFNLLISKYQGELNEQNYEDFIRAILKDKIILSNNRYEVTFNGSRINFDHMGYNDIINALIVRNTKENTKEDPEFQDIIDKAVSENIDLYFNNNLIPKLRNGNPIPSPHIIEMLRKANYPFTDTNNNLIDEIIEILRDKYGIDIEEVEISGHGTKALQIVRDDNDENSSNERDEGIKKELSENEKNTAIDNIVKYLIQSNHIVSSEEIREFIGKNNNLSSSTIENIIQRGVEDKKFDKQTDLRGIEHIYLHDINQKPISQQPSSEEIGDSLPPVNPPQEPKNPRIEQEDRDGYELSKFSKPTMISGGLLSLAVIGALSYNYSDEIINYVKDLFENDTIPSSSVTNTPTIQTYTVLEGDNLWNISHSALGSNASDQQILQLTNELANINNLSNPDLIHPGDQITIPNDIVNSIAHEAQNSFSNIHVMQGGDSLWSVAQNQLGQNASVEQIKGYTNELMNKNGISNPREIPIGAKIKLS